MQHQIVQSAQHGDHVITDTPCSCSTFVSRMLMANESWWQKSANFMHAEGCE
jgi:hypothetical protein